jgi:hypothetical protein
MINFFYNTEHLQDGSPLGSFVGSVESNVFIAHLMELDNQTNGEVDLTPMRASSCCNSRGRGREPSLAGGAHEFYVLSTKKNNKKRRQRCETEERIS